MGGTKGLGTELGNRAIGLWDKIWGLVPLALIALGIYLVYNATKPEGQRWREAHQRYERQHSEPKIERIHGQFGGVQSYEFEYAPDQFQKPKNLYFSSKEERSLETTPGWDDTGLSVQLNDLLVFRNAQDSLEFRIGGSSNIPVGRQRDFLAFSNGDLSVRDSRTRVNIVVERYFNGSSSPKRLRAEFVSPSQSSKINSETYLQTPNSEQRAPVQEYLPGTRIIREVRNEKSILFQNDGTSVDAEVTNLLLPKDWEGGQISTGVYVNEGDILKVTSNCVFIVVVQNEYGRYMAKEKEMSITGKKDAFPGMSYLGNGELKLYSTGLSGLSFNNPQSSESISFKIVKAH